MTHVRYMLGDVREVLATLPPKSVDLVLTSPPFLRQRSYLPDDHPDKAKEIGSEPNPGAFIDTLLDVVELCAPALTDHGSIAWELGDKFSGTGAAGGDYDERGLRSHQPRPDQGSGGDGWPDDKSLALTPELFRVALAYGMNPLTGRTTPRWRVRNVVRWCRPNPSPGELFDKYRPATSEMAIACKAKDRWFDIDPVRKATKPWKVGGDREFDRTPGKERTTTERPSTLSSGAPPMDHWWFDDVYGQDAWLMSGTSYRGQHYATWPTELLTIPILSMCPGRVCMSCGLPVRRVTERLNAIGKGHTMNRQPGNERTLNGGEVPETTESNTVGWSCCGCGGCGCDGVAPIDGCPASNWRRGVVLDPFGGTGTTGVVAAGCGRDAIMVDLDDRNLDQARERLGLFLDVDDLRPPTVASVLADVAPGWAP